MMWLDGHEEKALVVRGLCSMKPCKGTSNLYSRGPPTASKLVGQIGLDSSTTVQKRINKYLNSLPRFQRDRFKVCRYSGSKHSMCDDKSLLQRQFVATKTQTWIPQSEHLPPHRLFCSAQTPSRLN